jgi:hypothetical protein
MGANKPEPTIVRYRRKSGLEPAAAHGASAEAKCPVDHAALAGASVA